MYVPDTMSLLTLIVTVGDPLPLMLVLLSVTAGPIGAAVIVRSTVLSKPYFGSRVIFAVPELPAVIISESTLVVNVKSGVPGAGAVTVTATLVVWVTGPLVPVMVTMFSV